MAAQKLTKGRLAQILIMMAVLIAAFTYRTFTYNDSKTIICQPNSQCDVSFDGQTVTFIYQESAKVLKFTKTEDLTIEARNIEGTLTELAKNSSTESLAHPIDLQVTSRTGNSVSVVIE
ncbi:hypothetical protein [Vibrio methylphosphonaticus]|uniref:hypothetical protein n=1 Tax=Vibrio methylphosphonaticus TaxID=2946866 RepID=UPI00202A52E7|nr:hypothetical protein [Vibrio methylphosphonaticus]MCL9776812.1 hypothetical protein [Vibrio methylphosphonaticus]